MAFEPSKNPKIILATNIAESSVTIPDVKFVIDFCLTKFQVVDSETKLSSLDLHWTSRNSCEQRAGRCGRLSEGFVYRLVFKQFYQHQMRETCIAEMVRSPMETVVLRAKVLDMGTPKALLALAMDPPNETDILNTITSLKEVGALLRLNNKIFEKEDGILTFIGRVMASLPLNVNLSRLIILGYAFNVLHEAVVIAAALSLKRIFKIDLQNGMEIYNKKMECAAGSGSDCIALYNAFQAWNVKYEDGSFSDPHVEQAWCRHHYVDMKGLNDLRELVKEIIDRLDMQDIECLGLDDPWEPVERDLAIKSCIAGAFYPNFYLRNKRNEEEIYRLGKTENLFNSVCLTNNVPQSKQIEHDSILLRMYEDQLKDQFVKFGICNNKHRIKLNFDADRRDVIANFDERTEDDDEKEHTVVGKVLPEVYRAIKSRLLGNTMEIKLMG